MNKSGKYGKNMREALIALAAGAGLALVLAAVLCGLPIVDLLSAAAVVFVYVVIVGGAGVLCASTAVDLMRSGIFLTPRPHRAWALLSRLVSRLSAPAAPPPRGALSA